MKKLNSFSLFLLMVVVIFSCKPKQTAPVVNTDPMALYAELDKAAPVNTLPEAEAKAGWQLLSDGADFTGWHGFNMKGVPDCWTIEDGCFTMTTVGRAESQDIVTDKIYKSFALFAEFKLDTGANSGIIWQIKEDTIYKFPYETGPEYQVIDHANWPDSLADWQICGANYAMYPPKVQPFKPLGEWNQAFLVVNGNKVTQFLNGELVVEFEKYSDEWNKLRNSGKWANFPDYGKYDEGHISLQNHGTKVWYRNVKIKEL
jgi:hypothetical protein